MITSETPYKVAEIIRDTWPNLYKFTSLNDIFMQHYSNKEKLKDFPSINFISIHESKDRRSKLYEKFEDSGLGKITPHIFEKYDDSKHVIVGNHKEKLTGLGRGPLTSHLKAIKDWYFNTDEEYTFFCEDDLSFESVKYWNFTWKDFFNSLPKDWECVQLCWVREYDSMFRFSTDGLKFRERCWCDWSACAYLIKRSHAKKLIKHYYKDGEFILDYFGTDSNERPDWALRPVAETVVFTKFNLVYGFPLFLEDAPSFSSTHNLGSNIKSYNVMLNWWKENGKTFKP